MFNKTASENRTFSGILKSYFRCALYPRQEISPFLKEKLTKISPFVKEKFKNHIISKYCNAFLIGSIFSGGQGCRRLAPRRL